MVRMPWICAARSDDRDLDLVMLATDEAAPRGSRS